MAASDSFKQALQAGDITKALKLALSEAIELKITTWVAADTGPDIGPKTAENAQPGHRMQTRINIVDGDIDNEIGSLFLQQGPYSELQGFHLQQAREGRSIIHQNLTNVQQLISLWAKAMHRDVTAFAQAEPAASSGQAEAGADIVEIPEEDIATSSAPQPVEGRTVYPSAATAPPVPDEGPAVVVEEMAEPDEADMEDLLFGAEAPIEDWAEEEEPRLVEELAEEGIEEDVVIEPAPEIGLESTAERADLDEMAMAMGGLTEEAPPAAAPEEADFDVSAFDEMAEAPAESDVWGDEALNLEGFSELEGGLDAVAESDAMEAVEGAIAEAPEADLNFELDEINGDAFESLSDEEAAAVDVLENDLDLAVDKELESLPDGEEAAGTEPIAIEEFPDFTDQLEASLGSSDDAWGSMPEEFREPTPASPPSLSEDMGDVTETDEWGEIADDIAETADETLDEAVTDLPESSGLDDLSLEELALEEPSEPEKSVDFDFERIEVLSENGNAGDPLGLSEAELDAALADADEEAIDELTPAFESEPPGNAWSDAADEALSEELADVDNLSLEEEGSSEAANWEDALFSNENGATDPFSALNAEADADIAWPEEVSVMEEAPQAEPEPTQPQKPLSALDALFDQEEVNLDAPEEFSTPNQNDPLATLFGETPPDSLREFLSDADAAIANESLLDDEEANPFADFPDSSDFEVEGSLEEPDRWFDDDADNNSMPEFAPPSDRQ